MSVHGDSSGLKETRTDNPVVNRDLPEFTGRLDKGQSEIAWWADLDSNEPKNALPETLPLMGNTLCQFAGSDPSVSEIQMT